MMWSRLANVAIRDTFPKGVKREGMRINARIAEIFQLRAEVDAIGETASVEWNRDRTYDRTQYFDGIARCYKEEAELREQLEIFLLAAGRLEDARWREARDRLYAVESKIRKSLGIADGDPNPTGAFQCSAEWHAARQLLASCSGCSGSNGDDRRDNANARRAASEQAERYASLAKQEAKMAAAREKQRERDRQRAEREESELRQPIDDREQRIAALMTTK